MTKLYKLNLWPYILWLKNASLLIFLFAFTFSAKAQTTCQAGFTYSILNNKVTFINTSTNSANNPMKYFWNFGDNQFNYDGENPTHYFYNNGKYVITLNAFDTISNCHSVFIDTLDFMYVYVGGCDADFKFGINNHTLRVDFSATAKVNSQKYYWLYGDSTTSNINDTPGTYNTSHIYSGYGTYNVCLIVTDSFNKCADTVCQQVIITKPHNIDSCRVNFYYTTNVTTVSFSSSAYCGQWSVTRYSWDFGDGDTSNLANPIHKFSGVGPYKVKLTVFGSGSAIPRSLEKQIDFQYLCNTNFKVFYDVRNTNKLEIKNTELPSAKIEIDFGDSTILTNIAANSLTTHTYKKPGKYSGFYKKTDTLYNCTNTSPFLHVVYPPMWCYAGFKAYTKQFSKEVSVVSDSFFTGKDSSMFVWDFGDGSKDSGIGKYSTKYTFAKDGKYKISLKTYNTKYTCSDTFSKFVTVDSKPRLGRIYGIVSIDASNLADSAYVYLVQVDDSVNHTLTAIDTAFVVSDTNSVNRSFSFQDVAPGRYIVKAALKTSSQYYQIFFPTYFVNELKWDNALSIIINNESIYPEYASINLKIGKNLGGPGFIGGKISAGANKKEGDPLKDIQVMLFNSNKEPVTYTYSDADGNFRFENLALGTYEVYTEVIGLETKSAFVTLTDNNPKVENVAVKVSESGITTGVRTKPGDDFVSLPKLYPNPAQEILYLETHLRKSQQTSLIIYNITGQQVYLENKNMQQGNQLHSIHAGDLPAGAYMLMLKNASGKILMQAKFMKY